MDPNVVAGSSFGVQWSFQSTVPLEVWYAKPLTYTLPGGSEMVITASNQNIVRVMNTKTGTLIAQRTLNPPFLQAGGGGGGGPGGGGGAGAPGGGPAARGG